MTKALHKMRHITYLYFSYLLRYSQKQIQVTIFLSGTDVSMYRAITVSLKLTENIFVQTIPTLNCTVISITIGCKESNL